jgi:diguanylate cyclase (GGDEF)-like protein
MPSARPARPAKRRCGCAARSWPRISDAQTLRRALNELLSQPAPQDPSLAFEWFLARATAHSQLSEPEEAIADALSASEVANQHQRQADLVIALDVLGVLNASRRDLRNAEDYARRGAALAREIDFRYGLARALVNLSYALAARKEDRERASVLEEVLRLTLQEQDLRVLHQNALINLAALHNDQRDYRKAAGYAARAEQAVDRVADPNGHAFALVNRGVALVGLQRAEQGLALVQQAVEIGEKTGDKRELADLLEQQVNALEAAGRMPQALATLRRWVQLNTELTNSQREQAIAQLQEQAAAQQRQREIERLKLEKARGDAELALRAWRERAWAGAALLVALLAFMIWQRLSRTRHLNRRLSRDVERLSDESQHDALTGAWNRRFGEALLQRLDAENRVLPVAQRRKVALVLLDIDHFKRVNDGHGHAAGDAVLVELTRRLQAMLRQGDAVVRWGGEEFLLILVGTDEGALAVVAGRLLAAIGARPVELPHQGALAVRASAGGVVWQAGSGAWTGQVELADAALYRAKAEGRNRLIIALAPQPLSEAELTQFDALLAAGRLRLSTVEGVSLPAPPAGPPG